MADQERSDILTAFVNALLERNGGVLVLSMDEVRAAWGKTFTYHMSGNDMIFSFVQDEKN